MLKINKFTFNPFGENTYVLSDDSNECVIVDPGCYSEEEKRTLSDFITSNSLRPVKILLTHAHIDHVLGNNYLTGKYGIPIVMNQIEEKLLNDAPIYGQMWGIEMEPSPSPSTFIREGDIFEFGESKLEVFFTPGHSPGSLCFLHHESSQLIAGDVLFLESIGRTDLPGGDFEVLTKSIREKLYTLNPEIIVYPGHGPSTTIGHEKKNNPFVQ